MKYSVWYMPYNKHYLLTHPWKRFGCAYRCIQNAWRRSVYGWTYSDAWDLDTWIVRTLPPMLRHIATYGSAYPGQTPFETPEKWHDWLHEMADLLETGREDWQDEHNEYRDEYMKHLTDGWNTRLDDNGNVIHKRTTNDITDKYLARENELMKQSEQNVYTALGMIREHFWELWD